MKSMKSKSGVGNFSQCLALRIQRKKGSKNEIKTTEIMYWNINRNNFRLFYIPLISLQLKNWNDNKFDKCLVWKYKNLTLK